MSILWSIIEWHVRISSFFFIALVFTQIYYRVQLLEVVKYIDPDKKVFRGRWLPMTWYSMLIISLVPILNFEMMLIMFFFALYNPEEPLSEDAKFVEYIKDLIKNIEGN